MKKVMCLIMLAGLLAIGSTAFAGVKTLSGIWYFANDSTMVGPRQNTCMIIADKNSMVYLVTDYKRKGSQKIITQFGDNGYIKYKKLKDNVFEFRGPKGINLFKVKSEKAGVLTFKLIRTMNKKGSKQIDNGREMKWFSQQQYIQRFTKWTWGIGGGKGNKYCCIDHMRVNFYNDRIDDTTKDYFTFAKPPKFKNRKLTRMYKLARKPFFMTYTNISNGVKEELLWLPLSEREILVRRTVANRPTVSRYKIEELFIPKEADRPEFWTRKHPKHWGYEGFRSGMIKMNSKDCDVTYYNLGPSRQKAPKSTSIKPFDEIKLPNTVAAEFLDALKGTPGNHKRHKISKLYYGQHKKEILPMCMPCSYLDLHHKTKVPSNQREAFDLVDKYQQCFWGLIIQSLTYEIQDVDIESAPAKAQKRYGILQKATVRIKSRIFSPRNATKELGVRNCNNETFDKDGKLDYVEYAKCMKLQYTGMSLALNKAWDHYMSIPKLFKEGKGEVTLIYFLDITEESIKDYEKDTGQKIKGEEINGRWIVSDWDL